MVVLVELVEVEMHQLFNQLLEVLVEALVLMD
jgi:hypothetical protein